MTDTRPGQLRHKQTHRKSRNGCRACKIRKVKCDESKPCTRCISFNLSCDLAPTFGPDPDPLRPPGTRRRAKGRPRKDWEKVLSAVTPSPPGASTSATPATGHLGENIDGSEVANLPDQSVLNVDDVELLFHFVTNTGRTLAGPNPPMVKFWEHNAPEIGLHYEFVLRLIMALSGFHLAFLCKSQADAQRRHQRDEYLMLAQRHLSSGLRGFRNQISNATTENCGALYLASLLVCYCTFAAGPTCPGDLLVCIVDTNDSASDPYSYASLPSIRGVRLLRESFGVEELFSGPMSPLTQGSDVAASTPTLSVCARKGIRRIDWEFALYGLRAFIQAPVDSMLQGVQQAVSQQQDRITAVCLRTLDMLINIYGAFYGRDADGGYDGPTENHLILGWLYRLERQYIDYVQHREPQAMLVLSYYAVLLGSVPTDWFLNGWSTNIISKIRDCIGVEYRVWLSFPIEQAGL